MSPLSCGPVELIPSSFTLVLITEVTFLYDKAGGQHSVICLAGLETRLGTCWTSALP